MRHLILAGSKSEYLAFVSDHDSLRKDIYSHVNGTGALFGVSPPNVVLHVVGTAHFTKYYHEVTGDARMRGIPIIDHCFPRNTIVMPSMEIVHDYADRLGISPEWRHRSPESDSS